MRLPNRATKGRQWVRGAADGKGKLLSQVGDKKIAEAQKLAREWKPNIALSLETHIERTAVPPTSLDRQR